MVLLRHTIYDKSVGTKDEAIKALYRELDEYHGRRRAKSKEVIEIVQVRQRCPHGFHILYEVPKSFLSKPVKGAPEPLNVDKVMTDEEILDTMNYIFKKNGKQPWTMAQLIESRKTINEKIAEDAQDD